MTTHGAADVRIERIIMARGDRNEYSVIAADGRN
jgi:hypothetical protein